MGTFRSRKDKVVSLASALVVTANANGTEIQGWENPQSLAFMLDVTAVGATSGDKLDAYVQTTVDGSNWFDIIHFAQILGDAAPGEATRQTTSLRAVQGQNPTLHNSALAAGQKRDVFGDKYRMRYDITSGSAPSFTVSVSVVPV